MRNGGGCVPLTSVNPYSRASVPASSSEPVFSITRGSAASAATARPRYAGVSDGPPGPLPERLCVAMNSYTAAGGGGRFPLLAEILQRPQAFCIGGAAPSGSTVLFGILPNAASLPDSPPVAGQQPAFANCARPLGEVPAAALAPTAAPGSGTPPAAPPAASPGARQQ